jgi:dihydroorotase
MAEKSKSALDLEEAQKRPAAYADYQQHRRGWVIPRPFNPHTHLRDNIAQEQLFNLVVPETAKIYDFATAMPNLGKNRIRTPEQAIAYRAAIRARGRLFNPCFDVTVPLYVEPDTDPAVVLAGFQAGAWKSGKIYPKNGTTGSEEGVDFRNISSIFPALEMMEKLDMLCLVHGEVVQDALGRLVADRKREPLAVLVIEEILWRFPRLRVVFEHISKLEAVAAVQRWQAQGRRVEATIAPQYLIWNSTVLFQGGMNPKNFSIPILGDEEDRSALTNFMLDGGGMLGDDSAPHIVENKSKPECCSGGVFNAPVSLFVYFHVFRTWGGSDWFEKFVNFACIKGRRFYDEALPTGEALITEESWNVPALYVSEDKSVKVIPMFAGMTMPYSYQLLNAE